MQSHQKVLFTPGPLTTSSSVKTAMLRDLGSRDLEFMELVRQPVFLLLLSYGPMLYQLFRDSQWIWPGLRVW